jgi:hypothetical protein
MDDVSWASVLDRLERDLECAERGVEQGVEQGAELGAWQPPTGLGPLPPELGERARRLAQRQQGAVERVWQALASTGQRLAASRRTGPPATRKGTSVYVDTTA